MKFTVVYLPSAESQLGELWLAADNKDAVRIAADEIDACWRSDRRKWANRAYPTCVS